MGSVDDDVARRRAERAEAATAHAEAQRRREEQESARAQEMIDRFLVRAAEQRLATEELTARPWTGRGRYRTGLVGWHLKRDRSVGVDTEGRFYVLVVAPERLGRWRTVSVPPSPPPLQVGKGARDGESFALDALLDLRLRRPAP